jgi:hypothetical protein
MEKGLWTEGRKGRKERIRQIGMKNHGFQDTTDHEEVVVTVMLTSKMNPCTCPTCSVSVTILKSMVPYLFSRREPCSGAQG